MSKYSPCFSGTFDECHADIENVNKNFILQYLEDSDVKTRLVSGETLNHYEDYQWSPSKLGYYKNIIFDNEAFYKVWERCTPWSNYFVFYIKKCDMSELIIKDGIVQTKEENKISKINKKIKNKENNICRLNQNIEDLRQDISDLISQKNNIEKNFKQIKV